MKTLSFVLFITCFLNVSFLFGQDQTFYSIDVLFREIKENTVRANLTYTGKRIRVKGFIVNFEAQSYVYLAEKDGPGGSAKGIVRILNSEIPKFANLYLGQEVIIEGIWKENNYYVDIDSGRLVTAYPLTIQPRTISMAPAVPREVLNNDGGRIINASILGRQGRDNSIWIYQTYNGKRLKIQGRILDIRMSSGQAVIDIGDDNNSSVRIWFQENESTRIIELVKGELITVEGICGFFHAYRWPEINNAILVSQ